MPVRKKLFVVLGMHRSGTSVIARGLKAMGVSLGENLLPAMAEVNERGFWEDQDFLALDVELMNLSGLDWYDNCPGGRFQAGDPRLEPYKDRAVQLLKDRLEVYPSFAVKDPRMAVLLPFWRAVFEQVDCDVVYLIAVRNPKSVVDSIVRRDGFGAVKVYYLWLEHVLSSLLETVEHPRVVVDYDAFMTEPSRQLERISQALGLVAHSHDKQEIQEFCGSFLSAELRHSHYGIEDLRHDAATPPDVIEIYSSLLAMADNLQPMDGAEMISQLGRITNEYRKMEFIFAYLNGLERRLRRLKNEGGAQAEILELERVIQWQEKRVHERDVKLGNMTQSIAELDSRVKALQSRLNKLELSISWRLTSPLRRLVTWLRNGQQDFVE